MGRGLIVVLAAAAWAPAAHACDVTLSQAGGAAPLAVTYTALCPSTSYRWTFADGTTAEGATVTHTFAAGRWGGTLETDGAADALPTVTATALVLRAPRRARFADGVTLAGTVTPAAPVRIYRGSALVTAVTPGGGGRFRTTIRLLGPGPYAARAGGVSSAPQTIHVAPRLEARVVGTAVVGGRLTLVAKLRPRAAGSLRVRVGRRLRRLPGGSATLRLSTRAPTSYRIQVDTAPADGWERASAGLDVPVVYPDVGIGDRGPSVVRLQQELARLGYASLGADGAFEQDTLDAVIAFQKVERLPRTGRADEVLWSRLGRAATPRPRYGGPDHVEVDKGRQVLFLVRGGKVTLIVPVSTAGIAGYSTPEGRFAVYRKVAGLDDGPLGPLYDPSYFTGGYAVHGSPSVPPYPASHGCVRVPMWISWRMYSLLGYGEPVYVYS